MVVNHPEARALAPPAVPPPRFGQATSAGGWASGLAAMADSMVVRSSGVRSRRACRSYRLVATTAWLTNPLYVIHVVRSSPIADQRGGLYQCSSRANWTNRPGRSLLRSRRQWLVAIIGTILGFLAAVLLQFIQQSLAERSKRERVRRVLYIDLAELFFTVDTIMEDREIQEPHRSDWQKDQLKTHVAFKGEKHLRANEDVYMELPERTVADTVFAYFHRALDNLDAGLHSNWSIAAQIFSAMVCEGRLKHDCFRKFIGKKRAERLYSRYEFLE